MNHQWRSLLFVPGDSARKLAKSDDSDADLVIYDLEDAVLPEARSGARKEVTETLKRTRGQRPRCVRINPPDTQDALKDLKAVMAAQPDYIMLPKVNTPEEIDLLANRIDAFEHMHQFPIGGTRIIALVTETAEMTLRLTTVQSLHPRVAALTWGAEDLATALGASTNRAADGQWTFTYQLARSHTLLAARACGVAVIDTVFTNFSDAAGMSAYAEMACRDGFDGVLAIHPGQIAPIHAAFEPSAAQLAEAQAIVDVFASSPGAGALQLNGKILDKP
ncbi:MAG: CoA ester lyase, partial [Pseudomonadota bacterium]